MVGSGPYAAAVAFCFFLSQKTNAQVSSIPFTASLDTFSVISGITLDAPNVDDVVYQNLPIGFNFSLGGTVHDKMSVSTNGNIELDSTGSFMFVSILNGSRNNLIAPFAADLINHNTVLQKIEI